jgi:uncharacterized protein YcfJ
MDKEAVFSRINDGIQLVATAGTAEALASSATLCRRVIIHARKENTDDVVIGGSTVVALATTRRGVALAPGQSLTLNIDDLNKVYVDALVSGEGVSFVYFNN